MTVDTFGCRFLGRNILRKKYRVFVIFWNGNKMAGDLVLDS